MARRSNKGKRLAPTVTSPAKMGEEMAHPRAVAAESPNVQYRPRGVAGKGGSIPDAGTAGHRTGHQERLGAKYAPQMPLYVQNAAAASETQKNVRLVPSAIGNRDFWTKRQYGQVQQ